MAQQADGPVLELGCGTGRVAIPVARHGATVSASIDPESMLAARGARVRRARLGRA